MSPRGHDLVRERGARRKSTRVIYDDAQQSYRAKSCPPKGLRRRRVPASSQLLPNVPHCLRRCSSPVPGRRSQRGPREFRPGLLVVGAGAVGGYFGARLAEIGRDVTFLVRPKRAADLARTGLIVNSRYGDISIPAPQTVLADELAGRHSDGRCARSTKTIATEFDLVMLSCKAYDLENAMQSFAPAVASRTAILPLLNGIRHLDLLESRFGKDRLLGGQCFIAATLNEQGHIVHMSDQHGLSFGELDGARSNRVEAITSLMSGAGFESRCSDTVILDMWEKWAFLSTLAGGTCLMRATIGDIVASPGGLDFILGLFEECCAISAAGGHTTRPEFLDRWKHTLTTPGSLLNASMLRDIEAGSRVEADHIIGDLLERGRSCGIAAPKLAIVYAHLKSYEARRERQVS